MSSFTNTSDIDNLFLETLMGTLQIRPQNPLQHKISPLFNQTPEDLLLDTINISDTDTDHDDDDDDDNDENSISNKTQLAIVEKQIIKIILSGKGEETLKPNSGQEVSIGEHYVCIGYHDESGLEYRVWEWHGHIMLFDDENGYNPEYIYGNYFERLRAVNGKIKETEKVVKVDDNDVDKKEKNVNFGLKELIGSSVDSGLGRILNRNMNAGSSRV